MADNDKIEWVLLDTDLTTRLAILPAARSHLYLEHNEPGSGELKIPLGSNSASLIASGMFAQCNYRGAARGGFFIENISRFEATAEEGGGRWMSISGRGALAILEDAMVWDDGTAATSRTFAASTMASVMLTLIAEAVARGGLSVVTDDFSATNDSNAVAWTDSDDWTFSVGTSLLDVLRQFVETGSIEFKMTLTGGNFVLSAYQGESGTDLSETIYFRTGTNCEEVFTDERGDGLKNAVRVAYKDGYVTSSDSTSITNYRRRETFIDSSITNSGTLAGIIGAGEVSQSKDPKKSISVRVYDGVSPRTFLDYDMGDYVMLDVIGTETSYRVLGMQLDFSGEDFAQIVVEMNSILYEKRIRQDRQITRLMNLLAANSNNSAAATYINQWFRVSTDFETDYVKCFAVDAALEKLYVGGSFTKIGGIEASNVAVYDLVTSVWEPLDIAVTLNADVNALAVSGTTLFIGGSFTNAAGIAAADRIVKYNITTGAWAALSVTPNASVNALLISGDHLFIGGNFTVPADSDYFVDYSVSADTYFDARGAVYLGNVNALALYSGKVYLAGDNTFTFNTQVTSYTIATNAYAGIGTTTEPPIDGVYALAESGGILYAGGDFGYIWRYNIAEATYTHLGTALDIVYALAFDNYNHLIISGAFTEGAGIAAANYLIRYSVDSGDFSTVGDGGVFTSNGLNSGIFALMYIPTSEILYVGGNYEQYGFAGAVSVFIQSLPAAMEFLQQQAARWHPPVTIATPANGLSITDNQVLSLGLSSTSTTGALSDTDWDTFNNKIGTVSDTASIDLTVTGVNLTADVKVDSINDTHIDWGTGANQVSLDDVPDGSTYVRITAVNHTDLTDGGETALHTHAGASTGELLMQDGVTSPPVPLETEDGTDWLYSD